MLVTCRILDFVKSIDVSSLPRVFHLCLRTNQVSYHHLTSMMIMLLFRMVIVMLMLMVMVMITSQARPSLEERREMVLPVEFVSTFLVILHNKLTETNIMS